MEDMPTARYMELMDKAEKRELRPPKGRSFRGYTVNGKKKGWLSFGKKIPDGEMYASVASAGPRPVSPVASIGLME